MPDHNPANLQKEYVIAVGNPGAGASLPVDVGGAMALGNYTTSHEEEVLTQLLAGQLRFRLTGTFLKGDWQLTREYGNLWWLQKLDDAYATTEPFKLKPISIFTGRSIEDLYAYWKQPKKKTSRSLSLPVTSDLFEEED